MGAGRGSTTYTGAPVPGIMAPSFDIDLAIWEVTVGDANLC